MMDEPLATARHNKQLRGNETKWKIWRADQVPKHSLEISINIYLLFHYILFAIGCCLGLYIGASMLSIDCWNAKLDMFEMGDLCFFGEAVATALGWRGNNDELMVVLVLHACWDSVFCLIKMDYDGLDTGLH